MKLKYYYFFRDINSFKVNSFNVYTVYKVKFPFRTDNIPKNLSRDPRTWIFNKNALSKQARNTISNGMPFALIDC